MAITEDRTAAYKKWSNLNDAAAEVERVAEMMRREEQKAWATYQEINERLEAAGK